MTLSDTSTILSIVSFAGMVVMTVAYFKAQSKNGSNQANKDLNTTTQEVITTYKTQVEQYKDQLANYRKDMHDLTLKIGELQGTILEKDRQNKELREILLGRNPAMDEFYKKAIPLLGSVEEYMQTAKPTMEAMGIFLEKNGIKIETISK